ncbi:hypothetical protein L873DRAFT_1758311 [Choiromyces venosus 120613-1]|uniref:C2H2-type domain-containing protein n=1 Tax=Choiromyces venosus 120613-1 TaxID=1336337 RepID=A0A3N4K2G1_9PEZI|nr:hypothetical protein L873DRAFT_1758311 [Choiromyces venosus 120613-1]
MDLDIVTTDALKGHEILKLEKGAHSERKGSPVEVEFSSSETAVSLMALAAGDDRQPFTSATSLPGVPAKAGGTAWAPNARAKSPNTGQSRGLPPSPSPSTQLFQNNKLPLLNSPTLPSMIPSINSQPANSPNSLPPGNDGRHTTLPPVSSIQVLADIAEKAMPTQSSTNWTNTRMPPNTRTVYPTVSSHVSVAPSNRTTQAPQSPNRPTPPGQSPHSGFGTDASPRPPVHHMTVQQKQFYLNQDPPSSSYYSHTHQHYQSAYPPMKAGSSPNTNGSAVSYQPNITHSRELPGIMQSHSPPSSAPAFFTTPPALPGRRDSTTMDYYPAGNTPPSGPSTGDTMPSSGTEDTITSPRSRSAMAPGSQGPLASGGFKCEYAGCKAPPFQTQYLLNSHANVHSSVRPHYCPVKGCSRAEGGKGFKRKNEMIRHGLVHDSPGYVCPFCPDREHKYPRPDNLQRHVRVHHVDKDKDDPQLRDVLAQRPEGGNRGRRRRLGS